MSEPDDDDRVDSPAEEEAAPAAEENNWETVGVAADEAVTDEKIVLNVGGIRHETLLSTLAGKTDTRLYRLATTHTHHAGRTAEYFFDRHPGVFGTVMDYYRSGEFLF